MNKVKDFLNELYLDWANNYITMEKWQRTMAWILMT